MELKGKRIAVIGAGRSGFAAAALASSRGARVDAYDSGSPEQLATAQFQFSEIGVNLICGEEAFVPVGRYDLAVISPGIDSGQRIGTVFQAASDELIGEIELAYRLGNHPIIAITGTNGKTTTTSLIADMLVSAGLKAVAAGNIGRAYSEIVLSGERLDWVVLELSSFQLETISRFTAEVAIWMNFAPDHMDRYTNVDAYYAAKYRIFENRAADALAIYKWESGLGFVGNSVTFSAFHNEGDFLYDEGEIHHVATGRTFPFHSGKLQGKHNAENVMVALAVADHLGLEWNVVAPAILAFQALPHRCEKVATIDGITYLNDSKSTNLHSLESALMGQDEPVVLIAGGKNKGLDYRELRDVAGKMARVAVCIGETAGAIIEAWNGALPCRVAGDLQEAVSIARDLATAGDVVLFSPGTSSFDMFTGYEARGEAFREAVTALSSH